jgi:hypothetical protein
MKTKLVVIIAVSFLLAGTLTFGSDVGNNEQKTGWNFGIGSGHSTRAVELDDRWISYTETISGDPSIVFTYFVDEFDGEETLDTLFVKASYGWGDRYAFYLKAGMARLTHKFLDVQEIFREDFSDGTFFETPVGGGNLRQLMGASDWDVFYGAGFKAVFFESGGFKAGVDVQYNAYSLDQDTMYLNSYFQDDTGIFFDRHILDETETSEYHLAVIFSKQNTMVHPYGGIKLSAYETEYEGRSWFFDGFSSPAFEDIQMWDFTMEASDMIGFFAGVDYAATDIFHINGEIRVGDEAALTAMLSWKF